MKTKILTLGVVALFTFNSFSQTVVELVKDINPTGNSGPEDFITLNGKMLFVAADDIHGDELWTYDGVSDPIMLKDINSSGGSFPKYLTTIGNKLFFSAAEPTNGRELWISDGSPSGTKMLKDIDPTPNSSSYPERFVILNGKLYFQAKDGTHGYELWVTDGTETGTKMVIDINVGPNPGYAYGLISFNNHLYFQASTPSGGWELYESDGTEAGTYVIAPTIAPFSDPCAGSGQFYEYNNALYFAANFNNIGDELYRIVGSTAGVQEQELVAFKAFPNPTTDMLTISTEKDSHFTLYDLTGKALKTVDVIQSTEISISDLNAGIYILRENSSGSHVKIVKE